MNGSGSSATTPNGFSSFAASGRKTRGCRIAAHRRAKRTSGASGASTPRTQARLITKTSTPEIADSTASTRIDASTIGVFDSPVSRPSAATRAAGVQTPPGMYFASIETISAWSATR